MKIIVMDTNVLVAALRSGGGASRRVLRAALEGACCPLFGNAFWSEYEDVLTRGDWDGLSTAQERSVVLAGLARAGRWVNIHYGWRPNLPDESDNHLIELAVAGGATDLVTHNLRDLRGGELRWAHLRIVSPAQFLETAS